MLKLSFPLRLAVVLVVAAGIALLSVVPGEAKPGDSVFAWLAASTPPTIQKLMHLAAYALLAYLWIWALEVLEQRALRIALALVFAVAQGAILEWYQTMVPGRFGSVLDIALNAVGAVLGLLAALLIA